MRVCCRAGWSSAAARASTHDGSNGVPARGRDSLSAAFGEHACVEWAARTSSRRTRGDKRGFGARGISVRRGRPDIRCTSHVMVVAAAHSAKNRSRGSRAFESARSMLLEEDHQGSSTRRSAAGSSGRAAAEVVRLPGKCVALDLSRERPRARPGGTASSRHVAMISDVDVSTNRLHRKHSRQLGAGAAPGRPRAASARRARPGRR